MRHYLLLVAGSSLLAFVGCKSMNLNGPERKPSSEYKKDAFVEKGYEEAHHREMHKDYKLSNDQIKKELAGRTIWYKSAPNGRFHTYAFPQKINAPINWYKVLRSDWRFKRFNVWGIINDPDCCTPGMDCNSKGIRTDTGASPTMADTYGLDYCPGDDYLWKFVGKADWDYSQYDPACADPTVKDADQLDGDRESSCHLAFGTSTGAVGFRKFPNPRFNPDRWAKIGGWPGYEKRGFDGSVEPPFRVGISCASCHASFEPTRPPLDVNAPAWANISGTTGNPYIRISDILVSGVSHDAIENQLFTPISRPGTSDTSAVPNDLIGNPGTINAIINLPVRPQFTDKVTRWFKVPSCNPNDKNETCQTVSYDSGLKKFTKTWKRETKEMKVFHILKGGEDTVGPDLAVQRVYVNIGMCAEQCWLNHLTDLHTLNPKERGFGQTPFNIAQCRADCAPWRANEDRVGDIFAFLLSARSSDLKDALYNTGKISGEIPEQIDAGFKDFLENRYGEGSVERGRFLFAKNCASCHSSQNRDKRNRPEPNVDFMRTNFNATVMLDPDVPAVDGAMKLSLPIAKGEILRADWMGNDKSTEQTRIRTYACRAFHSNHKKGNVWDQFASDTYHEELPAVLYDSKGKPISGGPGYYRNISLLNSWAYAPFLHNNSVGPEICGRPDGGPEFHKNTYEGEQRNPEQMNKCDFRFDPSVEARLTLFDKSMDELLTAEENRRKKMAVTTEVVRLPLGVSPLSIGRSAEKFYLEFPPGFPLAKIGNFNLKQFLADVIGSLPYMANETAFKKYWTDRFGADRGEKLSEAVKGTIARINDPANLADVGNLMNQLNKEISEGSNERLKLYLDSYLTCRAAAENVGHNILTDPAAVSKQGRNDLKAFLATF